MQGDDRVDLLLVGLARPGAGGVPGAVRTDAVDRSAEGLADQSGEAVADGCRADRQGVVVTEERDDRLRAAAVSAGDVASELLGAVGESVPGSPAEVL
jgi:hypothetical protein